MHRRATGDHAPTAAPTPVPAFPHGLGQCDEVVLVGVGRQRCGVAHQLPATRCGDPAGVPEAQIPGVRLADCRQRPHHCGGVGVDVRQRRHRVMGAPGPAAATGKIHAGEAIARFNRVMPDTRSRKLADVEPLRSSFHGRQPQFPAGRRFGQRFPARTRDARPAAAPDRPRLAKPCGAFRHGGAGGLRADRAALA